jgi:diketogulonate reductase-like aldo/keto reductase
MSELQTVPAVSLCVSESVTSCCLVVLLQRGVMPVFTSRDAAHIAQGRAIFTYFVKIRLMKKLDALNSNSRFDWDPEFVEDT